MAGGWITARRPVSCSGSGGDGHCRAVSVLLACGAGVGASLELDGAASDMMHRARAPPSAEVSVLAQPSTPHQLAASLTFSRLSHPAHLAHDMACSVAATS